jgi:hypothetical protein
METAAVTTILLLILMAKEPWKPHWVSQNIAKTVSVELWYLQLSNTKVRVCFITFKIYKLAQTFSKFIKYNSDPFLMLFGKNVI